MRYVHAIVVAVLGVVLVLEGFYQTLAATICEGCSGDAGPGNRVMLVGACLLLEAFVLSIAILIREARSGTDED